MLKYPFNCRRLVSGGRYQIRVQRGNEGRRFGQRHGSVDPVVHSNPVALRTERDECLPSLHGRASPDSLCRSFDQLVRSHEPQTSQGIHLFINERLLTTSYYFPFSIG